MCVCVCVRVLQLSTWLCQDGVGLKGSNLAAVDYLEKLTDDIFITFSTLFFPNKANGILDAKSQQSVSRSTQKGTEQAFTTQLTIGLMRLLWQ